jgi:hypothetical protein
MQPWEVASRPRELLENVCGFALGAQPGGLVMLPSTAEHEVVAGDGMGGCFYLWTAQRSGERDPIAHLSSYAEASRFAEDFTAALTIVAGFPGYWGDVLVAAHKSDDLVGRVITHGEAQIEPECIEARTELSALPGLDLAGAADKVVAAVRAIPPFSPLLASSQGKTPAASFAARTYPR